MNTDKYLQLLLVHFGRDRSNSQKVSSFESLVLDELLQKTKL